MLSQVGNYIKENIDDGNLTAEKIQKVFKIPKYTLYRIFEHTGGVATYISACRLRAAIDDIINFPNLALKDIAYGVGFNSASAFSRSFRRSYGMTPQELRDGAHEASLNIRSNKNVTTRSNLTY